MKDVISGNCFKIIQCILGGKDKTKIVSASDNC